MTEKTIHIADLIRKHLLQTINAAEKLELDEWINASVSNSMLFDTINDPEYAGTALRRYYTYDRDQSARVIEKEFPGLRLTEEETVNTRPVVHRVHFLKTAWLRYAAAILILIGSGTVVYLWNQRSVPSVIVERTKPVPAENILPGGQKAILTLADGRTIVLDSAANGEIANEQGSRVMKKDGQVIYDAGQIKATSVTYNTMSTPRGGQYQLTLPDGTNAWLNAASSITYPTAFINSNREVNITGEVYFEVAANKSKPFIVKTIKDEITVMGTRFNVNAYADELFMKTSLIDGAVKINDQLLKPGQAYVNGKIINTNIEQDVAWTNGVFDFNDLKLKEAMRQIQRWYNVDVVFEEVVAEEELIGKIDRALTLKELLSGFNGVVAEFELKGRTLYVRKLK